jgi:hypothetical protein
MHIRNAARGDMVRITHDLKELVGIFLGFKQVVKLKVGDAVWHDDMVEVLVGETNMLFSIDEVVVVDA